MQRHALGQADLLAVFDGMPVLVVAFDEHGCVAMWNAPSLAWTGIDDDALDKKATQVFHGFPKVEDLKKEEPFDCQLRSKSGEMVDIHMMPAPGLGYLEPNWYWRLGLNITENRRLEGHLRESEMRYRSLVENSPLCIVVHSAGTIDLANEAACKALGVNDVEDLIGQPVLDFVHPEFRESTKQRVAMIYDKQGSAAPQDEQFIRADGSPLWVEATGSMIDYRGKPAAQVVFRDITLRKQTELEKQRLEQELFQSRKMESIGQLAGGIAHDFNNILTVVLGIADVIITQEQEPEQVREQVIEMRHAAQKAGQTVQQLLAFSRRQTVAPLVIDVNQVLSQLLSLLTRLIGEKIELLFEPDPNLWLVKMDPNQLEQIAVNLAANARDAMPQGGQFKIRTSNVQVLGNSDPSCSEDFVQIVASDSGIGMDENTQAHLFEPFFTTKKYGSGTGLGLASVYGIVMQNKGTIDVQSSPGNGTTFSLRLPRSLERLSPSPHDEAQEAIGGNETIMLVEDEELVRGFVTDVLVQYGYTVLTAENGVEAEKLFHEQGHRIDLLLTDVVLPKMDGRELYNALSKSHPHLRVLFMSGYSENIIAEEGTLSEGVDFIAKPFRYEALLAKVRQSLSGS